MGRSRSGTPRGRPAASRCARACPRPWRTCPPTGRVPPRRGAGRTSDGRDALADRAGASVRGRSEGGADPERQGGGDGEDDDEDERCDHRALPCTFPDCDDSGRISSPSASSPLRTTRGARTCPGCPARPPRAARQASRGGIRGRRDSSRRLGMSPGAAEASAPQVSRPQGHRARHFGVFRTVRTGAQVR